MVMLFWGGRGVGSSGSLLFPRPGAGAHREGGFVPGWSGRREVAVPSRCAAGHGTARHFQLANQAGDH